jgi:6-phosphogluconolactonase
MSDILASIDYGDRGTVELVSGPQALAREAADLLARTIDDTVAQRGTAFVALSGGSTPKAMGHLLAQPEFRTKIPWADVHVFWGDERWTPPSRPDSNAGEAMRAFLDHVGIPGSNVHPFVTEGVSPTESAELYERDVRATLAAGSGLPRFDLVLLGMGDDGHTASLFPGSTPIHEHQKLVVSHHVAKLNATRLTMTPPLLNAARKVVFLVAGAGKAERLHDVLDGPENVDELPSQVIRPTDGTLTWLVDEAAAALLDQQPE